MKANVKIKVWAAHKTQWHPSGYWCGDDVLFQLEHAITLFEVKHPGAKGLFLFDNSTGHDKMVKDALLTSRMNLEPGGQFPSQLRTTKYSTADGSEVEQSSTSKKQNEFKKRTKREVLVGVKEKESRASRGG